MSAMYLSAVDTATSSDKEYGKDADEEGECGREKKTPPPSLLQAI